MQPGDLVATLHVDLSVRHHKAEAMVQARSKPPPAHVLEIAVESFHLPDVSLHRADEGRTVWEKIEIAEKQRRLPRIFERGDDRIDSVGLGGSPAALRFEYFRPLRRTAPGPFGERVAAGRANHPRELTAFDPRRVQHFHV